MAKIKGFKVFRSDWTCSPNGNTKQYTCPGKFEEEGEIDVCNHGMHFCQTAADCFNYYSFNSENKVAEVIAYGDVKTDGNKLCTNKLEIVREIPWDEVLRIVNMGKIAQVVATLETETPETETLETGMLETSTLEAGTLGTAILVTTILGIATLETTTPETGIRGTTIPGTGIPESITSESATPGIGINHLLILVVSTRKSRRLCYSISHQI